MPILRRRTEELRHREVVEEIIEFLDLQAFRQSRISDCPYGVQKRCEIGRAIAMEPRLLLLDEPIAGLTAEEKEESAYHITEIRGRYKTAILLVEHDLKIASRLADRMVAFDHGELIARGTPEEVQRSPAVIQAYLGDEWNVGIGNVCRSNSDCGIVAKVIRLCRSISVIPAKAGIQSCDSWIPAFAGMTKKIEIMPF